MGVVQNKVIYFQIRPVKSLKTTVNCQNLGALHRTKQKLTQYACLKVNSCFVKEQEVLASVL